MCFILCKEDRAASNSDAGIFAEYKQECREKITKIVENSEHLTYIYY